MMLGSFALFDRVTASCYNPEMTESPRDEQTGSPRDEQRELPTLSTTLLKRVREMHPDGWSRLVEVFGPIVYRWCRQSGVSEHDASDVVQDVFISVARGVSEFEGQKSSGSFRSWLATITRNQVRDHFRRSAKRPVAQGGTQAMSHWRELEESIDQTFSESEVDGRVSRRLLELVKSEFEDRTWQAFWKTTIDQSPAADVAAELEIFETVHSANNI
jgi:RNA polymerase sigma-70 factor (ECF subfamily)